MRDPQATKKRRTSSFCAEGIEFYDECDSDDEIESIDDCPKFSHMKVQGRESELQLLHDAHASVRQQHQHKAIFKNKLNASGKKRMHKRKIGKGDNASIVMIRGLSGTGKSTLVRKFIEDLRSECSDKDDSFPFVLSGKFDEFSRADPFSAIVSAVGKFIKSLADEHQKSAPSPEQDDTQQSRKAICDSLDADEVSCLTTITPDLRFVTSIGDRDSDSSNVAGAMATSKENAWNRLKFIFHVFFGILGSMQRPIIFFLDDLQWCDPASLELLEATLLDKQLKSIMFIGACRADAIEEQLRSVFDAVEAARKIVHIEIQNVSLEQFAGFVMEALRMQDHNKGQEFAETIHRKTNGNIFFTLHLLEDLRRRGILTFSRLAFEWEWNLEGVNLDDILCDDVLATLRSKIEETPDQLQRLLILASCSRATLEHDTLQKLMELDGQPAAPLEMGELLERAIADEFFVKDSESSLCSFSHDRMQQAAYDMIPSGPQRDEF